MSTDDRNRDDGESELALRVQALPRDIAPERELWNGVAARIAAVESRKRAVRARRVRYVTFGAFALAAAVAGIFVASPRLRGTHVASSASSAAAPTTAAKTETAFVLVLPEESTYRNAIEELRAVFDAHQADFGEETAAHVNDSLRALDRAIAATRAALDDEEHVNDDANENGNESALRDQLAGELRDEYQQEIDVLDDVIDLTTRT